MEEVYNFIRNNIGLKMEDSVVIGVSGGPDSMALLDITKNSKLYIEVAHVNYHKRDSAKNDELLVRRYCKKNTKNLFNKIWGNK